MPIETEAARITDKKAAEQFYIKHIGYDPLITVRA